jgi:hypothetical protein
VAAKTGLFAIGGHARSGTTMLAELCHSHPELACTQELNTLGGLGRTYRDWAAALRKRPQRRRLDGGQGGWAWGTNVAFLGALLAVHAVSTHGGRVTPARLERTLRLFFPGRTLIGDKMPDYALNPRRLTRLGVPTVVIYRDCRDVLASVRTMGQRAHSPWFLRESQLPLAHQAERWVTRMRQMDAAQDTHHIIRYEALVTNPTCVLPGMAAHLGIAPGGFDTELVHSASLGKWRNVFSPGEVAEIESIAGPTLARLGYL